MSSKIEEEMKKATATDGDSSKDEFANLFASGTEFSGPVPTASHGTADPKPAFAMAKKTSETGRNFLYPLDKVAEMVRFDPHYQYTIKKTGKTHDAIRVLPYSVSEKIKVKYPLIGFKKMDLKDGTMGVLVYKK